MDGVDLDRVIEGELYDQGDLTLPRVVELCRVHPALAGALIEFFWAWEALGPTEAWAGRSGETAAISQVRRG